MLMDYIVVDLEMTGLDVKENSVIEIGAILVRDGKVVETYGTLVKNRTPILPKTIEITGITEEMAQSGQEEDVAMAHLLQMMQGGPLIGHNVSFDYSFIKQWAVNHKYPVETMMVDTLKLARHFLKELPKKTLDYLCEHFQIQRTKNHRALEDARATLELFQILEREFGEKEPELFRPITLQCKIKRQTPMTVHQKNYLKEFMKYHKIDLNLPFEEMSRSQASRLTDQLIATYGKMNRKQQHRPSTGRN